MQIDLCNKLINNDLTKEDLLERVEVTKTTKDIGINIDAIIAIFLGTWFLFNSFIICLQVFSRIY